MLWLAVLQYLVVVVSLGPPGTSRGSRNSSLGVAAAAATGAVAAAAALSVRF